MRHLTFVRMSGSWIMPISYPEKTSVIKTGTTEKDILQGVSDRYDRVVRVLGIETVDTAVQQDIQNEKVLEEKRRMEQMPKGNIHERLAWGMKKSEMENQQRKKTKSKNREMER